MLAPATLIRALLFVSLAALAAAAVADADARFARGLLWRVDSPGAAPSYLYGTLHSGDERVVDLAPTTQRAFARARLFALEMENGEEAVRRYRAAMVSRRPGLEAALGAEDYPRIAALLAERGVPAAARPHFKPWAALIVLIQPVEFPGIILDQLLLLRARALGKTVVQLESVEEQIDALDGMAPEAQVVLLREVAAHQERIAAAVRPLTLAYLEGDLAAMWQANLAAMGDDPRVARYNEIFLERLLFARSARFAERLAPLLRRGGVFAAFGALHLYGERGVPALLARRGFRVTAVRRN